MYLPSDAVFLKEVSIKKYRFDQKLVVKEMNTEQVLARTRPFSHLGPEYENLLIPALPCFDLVSLVQPEDAIGYLKHREGLPALASGKRSAILVNHNSCLRLKGCGNRDLGFNKEPLVYPEGCSEIRGCCFENTVVREQFMTFLINEKLTAAGFSTGNLPVEFWKYQEAGFEQIDKFCGVFQTFGEKRLGSHLIVGIERLVSSQFLPLVEENVADLMPDGRKSQVSTVRVIKQNGPLNESLEDWTRKGVYLENSCLVNVLEAGFSFIRDSELELQGRSLNSRQLIQKIAEVSLRIGWEVGVVKRVLQDSGISWGYFIDHNPFEPHCNAHCNNFIVLPAGSHNLLAPVDFDMSFTSQEFINLAEGTIKNDQELFENWVNCERLNLELTLAGQENMANFQYSGKKNLNSDDQSLEILQVLLKDLMVLGFRKGFERLDFPFEWKRENYEDLIRASLKMTENVTEY